LATAPRHDTPAPGSARFGPDRRLHSRREFTEAFEHGRKIHGRFVSVFVRENGRSTSRLGLTVTRKFGDAVRRNLAKRRLREVFRTSPIPPGLDVVVVPKREFFDASFAALESDLRTALDRRDGAVPAPRRSRPRAPVAPPPRPPRL
jgi:ribonuclease P protein component